MPMDKQTLQNALQAAFSKTRDSKTAAMESAMEIAEAIDAYIRTAAVTVTTQVTGTSATGGPVSGVGQGTGTLS